MGQLGHLLDFGGLGLRLSGSAFNNWGLLATKNLLESCLGISMRLIMIFSLKLLPIVMNTVFVFKVSM